MAARAGVEICDEMDTMAPVFVQVVDSDELANQATGTRHAWEVWADHASNPPGINLLTVEVVSNVVSGYSSAALTKNWGTTANRWSNLYGVNLDLTGTATFSALPAGRVLYTGVGGLVSTDGGILFDPATDTFTLGADHIYSQGTHGLTLAAGDWAVGATSSTYVFYDDSLKTWTQSAAIPIWTVIDTTAGSRNVTLTVVANIWQMSCTNGVNGLWVPQGMFASNGFGFQNANAGGSIQCNSSSGWDVTNNTGTTYISFRGRTANSDIGISIAQLANTTGTPQVMKFKSGAHTNLTNAVLVHALMDFGSTSQFVGAAGATTIATSDGLQIIAPVYGKAGAGSFTITDGSTLTITDAPSGVTLTRAMAIWVKAGWCRFDNGASVGAITTAPLTGQLLVKVGATFGADAAPTAGFAGDIVGVGRFSVGLTIAGTTVAQAGTALFTASAAPASPAVGEVWHDSTQKALIGFVNAGIKSHLVACLRTNTADGTDVTNTVTETSLVGTGVGTTTLPANFFVAGKTIRIRAAGYFSTDAAAPGTLRLRLALGAVTFGSLGTITPTAALASQPWRAEWEITCRTTGGTGTIKTGGYGLLTITGTTAQVLLNGPTGTTTIDTTGTAALDLLATWGTADADNHIVCTQFMVEVLA